MSRDKIKERGGVSGGAPRCTFFFRSLARMGRETAVLLRWRSLCSELGIDDSLAEEWGSQLREGYRYHFQTAVISSSATPSWRSPLHLVVYTHAAVD